jgi:predicted unusual protein kinase regulating ubiquinone biosynthesis (AarF/ABC1/UbiB family)
MQIIRIQRLANTADFAAQLYTRVNFVKNKRSTGKWIFKQLCDKGPLYKKLGQFVSTRRDLFPEEYLEEIVKLQDELPPFPIELGILSETYTPETVPIAVASIAQVVRGTDIDGNQIIIKLMRPDIRETFTEDIADIEAVLSFAVSAGLGSAQKILKTVQEIKPAIFEELDFRQEALNMQVFRNSMQNIPWIVVPKPIRVGEKHLVMEYIPGVKVTDVAALDRLGIDKKDLARRLMESLLIQILQNGIFHADMHPGNISVKEDGTIIYYDFGSMIYIEEYKQYVGQLIQSLIFKDVGLMIECLIQMKIIKPKGSKVAIKKVFVKFIDFIETMNTMKFQLSLADTQTSIRTSSNDSFDLDNRFIYMIKTANMLEGICRTLDPDFSYSTFFGQARDLLPEIPVQKTLAQDIMNVPSSVKNLVGIINDMEEIQMDMGSDIQKMRLGLQREKILLGVLGIVWLFIHQ